MTYFLMELFVLNISLQSKDQISFFFFLNKRSLEISNQNVLISPTALTTNESKTIVIGKINHNIT